MQVYSALIICLILGTNSADDEKNKVCEEESTNERNPVVWPYAFITEKKIASSPLCLSEKNELITRTCSQSGWTPKHGDVPHCYKTMTKPTEETCPPEYKEVVDKHGEIQFCYKLTTPSTWDYPCLDSGSLLTIFDLDKEDLVKLINKLQFNERKQIWLPAKRIVPYGPIVWTVPGDKWGEVVEKDIDLFDKRLSVLHSCLLIDIDRNIIKTDNCSYQYPSLCVTDKEHLLPLHCPYRYQTSKYGLNNGLCYGIEVIEEGATFKEFIEKKCSHPLEIHNLIEHYLYKELSEKYDDDSMKDCWFGLTHKHNKYLWYSNKIVSFVNWDAQTSYANSTDIKGVINEDYEWTMVKESIPHRCMACQININCTMEELVLQRFQEDAIQLTIYNQNNLWREDDDNIGVQCFTNAKGFVKKIEIDDKPYRRAKLFLNRVEAFCDVTKVVYHIERVNEESGEYWCEGHNSKNFSLIKTSTIIIPPKNPDQHDFVLKMKINKICDDLTTCNPDWDAEADKLQKLLNAKNLRFMIIENINVDFSADVIIHVSVKLLLSGCETNYCKIVNTFFFFIDMCKSLFALTLNYEFLSLKSSVYCLPEKHAETQLNWDLTNIGEIVAPKEFCMQGNGLPVTRQCLGSFIEGGFWGEVKGTCSENFEPSNKTTYLYSIAKGRTDMSTTSTFLVNDLTTILDDIEDIIPADIYFLAMSLKTIVQISDMNETLIELGDSLNIATAMNSLMDIKESYLFLAQTMNSSNVLLESVDIILSKIAQNETDFEFDVKGIDISIKPHYVIQISSPHMNNISGLAITRKEGNNSTDFTEMEIIQLTTNMTVFDVLVIPNLEVATWITQDILDAMGRFNSTRNSTTDTEPNNSTYPRIIVEVFYSDVVFQEIKKDKDKVNSRVISVTVPGFESDLALPLPLIYKRLDNKLTSDRACAYWDFESNFVSLGQWSHKGCYHMASLDELDVCGCFHLTHFAQLILGHRGNGDNGGEIIIYYYHGQALDAITLVGCSLSLVGVAGIAATAILFPAWRQKPGSKVLLQLSAAIALQSMMMVSQDSNNDNDTSCIIFGAMLHYSVLAAFMWMLLTALLQFARYVKVLGAQRPVRFMLKFSLAGWGVPIIPVAILLIVNPEGYLPPFTESFTRENASMKQPERDPSALCYPQGLSLYLSVLLPIVCIVTTNLIVFVLVMRSIIRGPDGMRRAADPELVLSQLRLSIILFFLLGLSWIFGLLAITGGRIIFSYLFCLTATLQGFVLFVYFVVCDPATRTLWVSLVRERSNKSISVKEISTTCN